MSSDPVIYPEVTAPVIRPILGEEGDPGAPGPAGGAMTGAEIITAIGAGVYDPAGTASTEVANHVAALDPHAQYALESALGTAAATAATDYATAAQGVTADAAVPKSLVDAKGDLLVGTADNTVARLAVGANGTIPVASSGATSGIAWALRSQLNPIMPNTTDGAFVTAAGSSGSATSTTVAAAVPFTLAAAATVSAVTIWVSALGASSAVGIAIYGTGTDGRPGSLIYDCGTVATTGTGKKTATLGVAQSLAPGVYWIATSCTTGTPPSLYGMASASSGVVGSAAAGNGLMADNLARAGAYGFITTAGAFTANPTWVLATAIGAVAANFQLTFSSVP